MEMTRRIGIGTGMIQIWKRIQGSSRKITIRVRERTAPGVKAGGQAGAAAGAAPDTVPASSRLRDMTDI